MTLPRWIALLGFLQAALLLAVVEFAHGEDSLGRQLNELDGLRMGPETPFEEVEQRSKQLLQEHGTEEDQGKTYSQLAHIYAQSGMSDEGNARAARRYAAKALEYPLDAENLLLMHIYLGDGLQVTDKADPFRVRRTRAAKAYLKGLREALDCGAPVEKPKYVGPSIAMRELGREGESGEMMSLEEGQRMTELLADADGVQAAKRAEVQRMETLWLYRRALFRQLIDMYGRRKPHAASELRHLATEIVGDQQVVAALMEGLAERGALKDDPIPETLKARSGAWFVLAVLPLFFALVVAIAIRLFRRTGRGTEQP